MFGWFKSGGAKQELAAARFRIAGMSCGGCVRHVDTALRALPGVTVQHVEVGSAQVAWDAAQSSADAIVAALAAAGYQAHQEDSHDAE
jgi:copper chaperone CopZ